MKNSERTILTMLLSVFMGWPLVAMEQQAPEAKLLEMRGKSTSSTFLPRVHTERFLETGNLDPNFISVKVDFKMQQKDIEISEGCLEEGLNSVHCKSIVRDKYPSQIPIKLGTLFEEDEDLWGIKIDGVNPPNPSQGLDPSDPMDCFHIKVDKKYRAAPIKQPRKIKSPKGTSGVISPVDTLFESTSSD